MDVTGIWIYEEDFEFGKSEGEVTITQSGNNLEAIFTFTEKVENNYKIDVVEKAIGTISDGKVLLKSTQVTASQDDIEIEYLPNNFEVYLISEKKLVGSTYDSQEVCGVFTLERK